MWRPRPLLIVNVLLILAAVWMFWDAWDKEDPRRKRPIPPPVKELAA
jgi:hypothetical protein